MIKRLIFSAILVMSYMSASAQIATPFLNRNSEVQSPAALGWKDGSTIGLQSVKAEGKFESDGTEVADATIGGVIPAVIGTYKGEELGLELYLSTDKTLTNDFDAGYEEEIKQPQTRLNAAYVFGEALSIGVAYRISEENVTTEQSGSSDYDEKETGIMVGASLKLADIFYIAGAMENVDYNYSSGSTDVDNSWSNTILGVGLLVGEPGESRFRVEYDMIQSPEKESDDDWGQGNHNKTDQSIVSVDALFGSFLLSYTSDSKTVSDKIMDFDGNGDPVLADDKTVVTQIGLGWMPEEGFSVVVHSLSYTRTIEFETGSELEINPTGYRIDVGWNF